MRPLVLGLLVATACTPKPADSVVPNVDGSTPDAGTAIDAGPSCGCERWGIPRAVGTLPEQLNELSGLVASRAQPGVFYAHNDSGDSARFFALSQSGGLLEEYTLSGATATDWEDVGLGPCPADGGTCVYLGDIGDNLRVRSDYALYVVREPTLGGGAQNVSWVRYRFEYPGGVKNNSEAFFVHPQTGRVYLVTKQDLGVSEIYRFPLPLDATQPMTLELVATLPFPTSSDRPLTGADVNRCGTAVLLRMYNRLVELQLPAGEADFEKIFAQAPVTVPVLASEPQGEAVAYGADGVSYFTASERIVDAPTLNEVRCR
ncbi:MAG: hypothetical protein ACOZQL_12355 [Myxococcota bacterium]